MDWEAPNKTGVGSGYHYTAETEPIAQSKFRSYFWLVVTV